MGDIAEVPRALPDLTLPDLTLIGALIVPAIAIGIIGIVQGAGVSQTFPNPDGKFSDVSRDFLGQGVANLAAASFAASRPVDPARARRWSLVLALVPAGRTSLPVWPWRSSYCCLPIWLSWSPCQPWPGW